MQLDKADFFVPRPFSSIPPPSLVLSPHRPPPNKMSEFEEAKVVADPEVEVSGRPSPEKSKFNERCGQHH